MSKDKEEDPEQTEELSIEKDVQAAILREDLRNEDSKEIKDSEDKVSDHKDTRYIEKSGLDLDVETDADWSYVDER